MRTLNWTEAMKIVNRGMEGRVFNQVRDLSRLECEVEEVENVPVDGWHTQLVEVASEEESYSYIDLRDDSISPANTVLFKASCDADLSRLSNFFMDATSPMRRGIQAAPFSLSLDIQDWIMEDYFLAAKWALVFGREKGFFRFLADTYDAGYMPVGWKGSYPEGCRLAIDPAQLADDPEWG